MRIARLGPLFMQGQIRLVRSPGCEELVKQLRKFPAKGWDDGPDALELAIRMICQPSGIERGSPMFDFDVAWS